MLVAPGETRRPGAPVHATAERLNPERLALNKHKGRGNSEAGAISIRAAFISEQTPRPVGFDLSPVITSSGPGATIPANDCLYLLAIGSRQYVNDFVLILNR